MKRVAGASALAFLAALAVAPEARSDEGMWPFNMVPKERIAKERGVKLDDAWLERLRLSSVRFNNSGSGSFVSRGGLVLTNQHVASDCVAKLARSGRDLLESGYLAGKDGPELSCPDLELNVLVAMEDVTEKVRAARKPDMSDADANLAIKGAMSELEKSCAARQRPSGRRHVSGFAGAWSEPDGARCEVVTLYAGARYDLYTYRKHTDVRLVFAPEQAIAFFGGDADNFNYPRFAFDMALLRVYEKGQPLAPRAYLPWATAAAKEGDVVFVSGHPGSTGRMQTASQLAALRDTVYPYYLESVRTECDLLRQYAAEGREPAREARDTLNTLENHLKAVRGFERGLRSPALFKKKTDDEAALRKAIDADPKWKQSHAGIFEEVALTQKKVAELHKRYSALEVGSRSELLAIARDLVRLPAELETPDDRRLREYADANLESLRMHLFSPAPLYGGVELALVRAWIERTARDLGPADPAVKAILGGRTPERAAREIVAGSKLFDVYARQALFAGGKRAIAESSDPAVVLMRAIDGDARAVRKRYDDEVEAPLRKAGTKIAQAAFGVRGSESAPDATFTLRLSTGVIKGYSDAAGKPVPWATDFAGLYRHATGAPPLKLPARWASAKPTAKMPFDFVSTNDIIGGNSGSPVVSAAGELVGLIFDGNLESLPNRFVYGELRERAVSLHASAMIEALLKVYGADYLVKELTAR